MMKQYGFSWSAALMAVGVGALAWAGPEAVQNVQKPALSGGTPVVFWNDHEQPDGSFDFKTGNRDLEGFLKLCQEEGMWVLFRPGPYACGEWDLGGLPHYLLKDPKAKLRTTEDWRPWLVWRSLF